MPLLSLWLPAILGILSLELPHSDLAAVSMWRPLCVSVSLSKPPPLFSSKDTHQWG